MDPKLIKKIIKPPGTSIEGSKNAIIMIKSMEQKYPEGKCGYCMQENKQIMPLNCGLKHGYCCECMMALIKITRIKKGLVKRFMFNDAAKCPQCNEIVVLEPSLLLECKSVKDVQDKKDELKKQKLVGMGSQNLD
jgi:hypothetical protein